ncbi:TPA: hypothetical protein DIV45_02775 [Patescibacteria group bacterium]|uniref:Uncharacterized protein n=2 Tax=Bacteria division Kazan-3B-28 TaxID=1798534 RepID=A0A0G1N0Z2_UNCK3|nr:MAG: hypothetical protein VE96_C0004G0022 [candidate division Kazan bacterium GW2011_GWA1_44_22]KKT86717.1 MAG: hypothetical protein VE97_C0020G0006 [candidate division Kazan bacterium GW2011_GWB1_45_10]HCR42257.1 hypothetical protein [Patescibacteria group bacterium]
MVTIEYPLWTIFLWAPLIGLLLGWILGKLNNLYTNHVDDTSPVFLFVLIGLGVAVWFVANISYATSTLTDRGLAVTLDIIVLVEFVAAGAWALLCEVK